ncbi:MAG: hypothetical protein GXP42_03550 [Chloroflexi bacterium]|nr:hypothetical protein [Chloroflexota bacterium]
MDLNAFVDTTVTYLAQIPGNIWQGLLFLGLTYVFGRKLAQKQYAHWITATSPLKPSLKERPSPCVLVIKGVFGCLLSIILIIVAAIFFVIAMDFLLSRGETVKQIMTSITQRINF